MKSFEYRDLLVTVFWDPTPGFFSARAWEEFGRSTPAVQVQFPFYDRRFISYVDRIDGLSPDELRYVGARLFDSLFQGDILRLYLHLQEQVRPTESKLRVRLRIDPPIAARLPWECLYDTRQSGFMVSASDVTMVRFHEPSDEPAPVAVRLPLRVVLAAECSSDRSRFLDVSREAQAVRSALRGLEAEGLVSVRELGSSLGEEPLTQTLLSRGVERDVDVLHLIVESRWEEDRAGLVLLDDRGDEDVVSAKGFATMLNGSSPRLLVLSGGAATMQASPELAEHLMGTTPALLMYRGLRGEDLASRFTGAFYRALGSLKPVDAALSDARSEAAVRFAPEAAWITPSLHLSRRDAQVFFNEARERVQQVYQLSEGRYRRRLRETLNRIWPKPERYVRQMLRWMPRQEPLTTLLQSADFLGMPQSAGDLAGRFQRLLLLGEAGAGKTMTLYRLFYETAQPILSYSVKSPLPIYVSLPDLTPRANLVDFLAEGLDRELFLKDLEEGRFLFLMDAVDALSAAMARRLAGTLNEFMRRYSMNRFVVAARSPIPEALDVQNWVEIVPFSQWESLDFLIGDGVMRPEAAKLLHRQLAQNLGARVGNPQVLMMARRLWREGARIPKNHASLFMAFYEVAGASLAPDLREGLLPRLALFMSRDDRISIRRQHLEEGSRSRELPHGDRFPLLSRDGVDTLLAEVGRTRLLRGPTAFSFPSVGFQEFLTAVALRSRWQAEVLDLVPSAQWSLAAPDARPHNVRRSAFHGALPFLCGLLDDSSELIEKLIERDLLLAAECYRESNSKERVADSLQSAIQYCLSNKDPLLQRVGCLSLEARGDRWAVAVLERVASNIESPARAQAMEALGQLRSERSVPLLKAAVLEKDPLVSRAALDALGRIKAG